MIPLVIGAKGEGNGPFVCKVGSAHEQGRDAVSIIARSDSEALLSGERGLLSLRISQNEDIDGDVLLVDPIGGRAERILRRASRHNTLLVTERCDQLCVMCSQPPKKTHHDRFHYFKKACLLAEPDTLIGISGGEPTLYKEELFDLIENTVAARPDLGFHVLSNGQHFSARDVERLGAPEFRSVVWGIPLYSQDAELHDRIVGKDGAFDRLMQSFAWLMRTGARVELRTVLLSENLADLPRLAAYVSSKLRFVEAWSIMQLENIGFAKNRWASLYVDHRADFSSIAEAIDRAQQWGVPVRLFNFPRCTIPENYRRLAPQSISDWKRKFAEECRGCSEQGDCSGFFEWHPVEAMQVSAL